MVADDLRHWRLVPAVALPEAGLGMSVRIVLSGLESAYLVLQLVLQYLQNLILMLGVEFPTCCT